MRMTAKKRITDRAASAADSKNSDNQRRNLPESHFF
jgi:hypothetical protein